MNSGKGKSKHHKMLAFGAGNETRTRYLHLGKVALYRMSYARTRNILYVTTQIRFVKQNFHVPDKFI